MRIRHTAPVLHPITSLTEEQHNDIKRGVLNNLIHWSTSEGIFGELVAKFKEEVKEHYFTAQRRRCCYCSIELHDHKITYDAEHILDKSQYPEYMFEPANLAAACRLCNQSKSNRSISASGLRFTELSRDRVDYSIVHPHLDDWADHLYFDAIGRIISVENSSKGAETIRLCGITALNAARLADEFSLTDHKEVETALRAFQEVSDLKKKRELVDMLDIMAVRYGHPGAKAVIEALKLDLIRLTDEANLQNNEYL